MEAAGRRGQGGERHVGGVRRRGYAGSSGDDGGSKE